ncbi:MAG: glycosyltransferase [Akkermansia sp.]|nr:glycosyltransferase [Akkermansia sp.]
MKREAPEPEFQLTVITVCWNALADLKPTVESVLRQKAKGTISIEHVVVDGASTDGTPEWLAEQFAAGNIERYVSEPDRGIYDAMNKAINLARGRVLTFMNAGDTYTDGDISCCVAPILEGKAKSAVGSAYYINQTSAWSAEKHPDTVSAYIDIIGCHQAYFFDAAATRDLGGYDSGAFHSAADLELMNAFMRRYGMPHCDRTLVANFYLGGFSSDCWETKRHEFIEIHWRSWEQICKRCRRDRRLAEVLCAVVARHCCILGMGRNCKRDNISEEKKHLRQMIRTLPLPLSLYPRRPLLLLTYAVAFTPGLPVPLKARLLHACEYLCATTKRPPGLYLKHMAKERLFLPLAIWHSLLAKCRGMAHR